MNVLTRADIMYAIAGGIRKRKDELAELESMNNGKPLREAQNDIEDAAYCFQYYAGLINKPYGAAYDVPDGFGKMQSFTVREPIGVCALITPWNYPLLTGCWKIAPALAAGSSR